MAIHVGIMGYGNLGRGIECAIKKNSDNIEIPTAEPFFDFSEAELTSFIENLPVNALNNVIIEYTGYAINSYISVFGEKVPEGILIYV